MHRSDWLSVSVVVPVYNEEGRIAETLEALLKQTYPKERYEVVVVDNGSTDRTREIVARFPVRLLHEPKHSSYAARNRGIRSTEGDYLAFVDSDCVAEQTWLEKLIQVEQDRDSGLVAGRIELAKPRRRTMGAQLVLARYSADRRRTNVVENGTAPTGNLLVRRELFDRLGMFDETVSGADTQFTKTAAARRRRPVYASEAVVWHPSEISNWRLIRRTFRIRYGAGVRMRNERASCLRLLRGVPWRPPVHLPLELRSHFDGRLSVRTYCQWLGFLWINNLAGWLGQISGYYRLPYDGDR